MAYSSSTLPETTPDATLQATPFFNFNHPTIQQLIADINGETPTEQAIDAYYRIRDNIRYNPYTVTDGIPALTAEYCLLHGQGYCIPKAALMVAVCRGLGIPARLGLADVRNHLASDNLLEWLGTDYFAMHGYADIQLQGRWVKCTPTFNKALCRKFNVDSLPFDGVNDAILQPATRDGRAHMEYLKDHGTFDEMPVEKIMAELESRYPTIMATMKQGQRLSETDSLEQDLD